jgi:NRPS condensation-like uncharacterized protein
MLKGYFSYTQSCTCKALYIMKLKMRGTGTIKSNFTGSETKNSWSRTFLYDTNMILMDIILPQSQIYLKEEEI